MSIKVILADDHPLVRDGLRSVIEKKSKDIEIIGEASNGINLLKLAERIPADIYIVDITMPILNGIEATSRLIKIDPKSKIIILSIHDNRTFVEKALRSGAKGYILKESATEDVIRAIHEVYRGRFYLSPAISKYVVNGFLIVKCDPEEEKMMTILSKREMEILQLIGESFSSKEIATRLCISPYTVLTHRKSIMRKLDVHRHGDLIRYAIKEGIAKF